METFLNELEKYAQMEKQYLQKHPKAQPLGNFYQYFGLSQMLNILKESQGREIQFFLEKESEICIYNFA